MRTPLFVTVALLHLAVAAAQQNVSLPASDGWLIHAQLYGEGKRGVVLVHGGRFTKESWTKQAQTLAHLGFRVLAIDMRGFGESTNGPADLRSDFGSPLDVLAAVRYLQKAGTTNVSVIGGSMGGAAAGEASARAEAGEIDRLIFIGSEGGEKPELMNGRKLFITSRDDLGPGDQARLPKIRAHYERTPDPKDLIILEGAAHAQFIFATEQGDRLMREILRFLFATGRERSPASPTKTVIHSAILNEDRNVIIHLPSSYASAVQERYPVMYVLDGTSQDGPIAAALAGLSDWGEVPEAIIVGIPNTSGNRSRDYTPPFMRQEPDVAEGKMGGGDRFLLFVEQELIPLIEKQYRTSRYRMISGNSRGGLLVLYSLLEKPDLFQARFCFSSPFHREDALIVNRTKEWLARNGSAKSFLYMSVGSDETESMKAGCESMKSLLPQQANGLTWFLEYTPNAAHGNNAIFSIPRALRKWANHIR